MLQSVLCYSLGCVQSVLCYSLGYVTVWVVTVWVRSSLGKVKSGLCQVWVKGNMHHKYDVSSKDAFYIIDLAAKIYF